MYITWQTLITLGSIITAMTITITLFVKVVHFIDRQKAQDEELRGLRETHEADIHSQQEELSVICHALLACLDGLKQLGANGNVTKAHNELEKHLNTKAHK